MGGDWRRVTQSGNDVVCVVVRCGGQQGLTVWLATVRVWALQGRSLASPGHAVKLGSRELLTIRSCPGSRKATVVAFGEHYRQIAQPFERAFARGEGSTADAAGAERVCVCADLFERAGEGLDVGLGEVLWVLAAVERCLGNPLETRAGVIAARCGRARPNDQSKRALPRPQQEPRT